VIKQVVLIILLSLAAIFFRNQLTHVLDGLVYVHNYIDRSLQLIFSEGHVGRLIQEMISLLILPLLGGLIIASIFWMIKRAAMPHIMAVVWVVWLVLLVTMVAQNNPTLSNAPASKNTPAGQPASEKFDTEVAPAPN
jgi:hypothetical protein